MSICFITLPLFVYRILDILCKYFISFYINVRLSIHLSIHIIFYLTYCLFVNSIFDILCKYINAFIFANKFILYNVHLFPLILHL